MYSSDGIADFFSIITPVFSHMILQKSFLYADFQKEKKNVSFFVETVDNFKRTAYV